MKREFAASPKLLATIKKPIAIEARVNASHSLFDLVFGTAKGWMTEIAPHTLVVFPKSIEDYLGAYKGWLQPSDGLPIYTRRPIGSEDSARRTFAKWAQDIFDEKWRRRRIRQAISVPVHKANRANDCNLVAYSLGDTSRALAQARLIEVAPKIFILIPFYLREISGPEVRWQSPEPGDAIQTTFPITSFDEAHNVLSWWATKTFAMNRQL